jgi:hypothetical protein
MKSPIIFVGLIVLMGFLLYWSRFELEYNVKERGVFEQVQVLEKDKWIWEGAKTELKYYDVCRRSDGLCWRRLPDNSYWVDDTPSYDSDYIAILANNRNGERVDVEFRFFETVGGRELLCRDCDLSGIIQSERFGLLYITGDIASLRTSSGPEEEPVVRLRLLDLSGGVVSVHHLADIDIGEMQYGRVSLYPDPDLRAAAWIACAEDGCRMHEYHLDSGYQGERKVECTPAPSAKLGVRVEEGRFVQDCE